MKVVIRKDDDVLAGYVADTICDIVRDNANACICFAAGDTPKKVLDILVSYAKSKDIDFSKCTFVGLDEWVGLSYEDEGSCHRFLYDNFFNPLHIQEENIIFFDAKAENLKEEAKRVSEKLDRLNGLDVALVGLGMNGHIGFNEPGTPFHIKAHVRNLDSVTKEVGKKYFKGIMKCEKGITLGFYELRQARNLILMATGCKKFEIVKKILEHEEDEDIPATCLKKHKNFIFAIDVASLQG